MVCESVQNMIQIKPYPFVYKFFDTLLIPAMYLISGVWNEAPQETHHWNLQNIPLEQKNDIKPDLGVSLEGTYSGFLGKSHGGILFHFPFIGGWKEYVVLEAITQGPWHLGWFIDGLKKDYFQYSRLTLLKSRVRALKPPIDTTTLFFALNEGGEQIPLSFVGDGNIGNNGPFKNTRLL